MLKHYPFLMLSWTSEVKSYRMEANAKHTTTSAKLRG